MPEDDAAALRARALAYGLYAHPEPEASKMTAVEVRAAVDPAGRPGVLIQLEHGYLLVRPRDAIHLANTIIQVAREVMAQDA